MELLKIQHEDFDLYIECTKFDSIWGKAKRNVGEENLTSTYSWSDGIVSVERLPEDADGQPIILSQLYRSEDSGDRYSINESPYEWKGKLYLRNVDKWDSHIETVDGHIRMSRTVHDKYDFDQKFIDSLKLHHI